jgi:hypothetical protein
MLVQVADSCFLDDKLVLPEYTISTVGFIYLLVMAFPSKWMSNSIAYFLGMVYFIYVCYNNYGYVKTELAIAAFFGTLWFYLCNIVMYSKLKALYETILKSKKLIKEMKKILQIFPHGVLIAPKENDKQFTNEVFDKEICQIREKLEEIDTVLVEVKSVDQSQDSQELFQNKNLHEFIHEQQHKICHQNSMVETDISIFGKHHGQRNHRFEEDKNGGYLDDKKEEEPDKRLYHVKSLEVEWEGLL